MTRNLENDYENEAHATFRIMGETLDPDEVTRLLGIEPSFARRKGDKFGNPKRPVTSRTGIWALESEKSVISSDLELHLDFLLSSLGSKASILRKLVQEGLEADIFCFWMSGTGRGGPMLGADTIRRIADLGVILDFDFYSAV